MFFSCINEAIHELSFLKWYFVTSASNPTKLPTEFMKMSFMVMFMVLHEAMLATLKIHLCETLKKAIIC